MSKKKRVIKKRNTTQLCPDYTEIKNTGSMVPVYPLPDFKKADKAKEKLLAEYRVEESKRKARLAVTTHSHNLWDWLNITKEEMEKVRDSGKNKCVKCGRDTSNCSSKILCQYHHSAFTRWNGKDVLQS